MTKLINKNILILIALFMIFITPSFANTWCYQETANVSTSCGGLSSGAYKVVDASNIGYFYINYTKPYSALNTSFWQVKHGNSSNSNSYNVTVTNINWTTCWNNSNTTLQFRILSRSIASSSWSVPQCFNGSWINIGNNFTENFASAGGIEDFPTYIRLYDGNWVTEAFYSDSSNWYRNENLNHRIFEEAMWWNLTTTPISLCSVLNLSDENYVFSNSFSAASASGACLNITASNVTINGNGSVIANGTSSAVGIYVTGNNVTFENLTFSNMSRYIATNGQNVTIKNITYINTNGSIIFAPQSTNLTNMSNTSGYCYQESANISTICGGLSTGYYLEYTGFGYAYISPANISDGDWLTKATPGGIGIGSMWINYTKPSTLLSSNNSIWQVKDTIGTYNLTIPASCWAYDATNLSFYVNAAAGGGGTMAWGCINSSGSVVLLSHTGAGPSIYEEAMLWMMPYVESNSSNIILNGGRVQVSNSSGLNGTAANISLFMPQLFNINHVILLSDLSDNGTYSICPSSKCTKETVTSGYLTFNVSNWTTYGAVQVDMNQTPQFNVFEYSNRTFYINISGVNISSTSVVHSYNGTNTTAVLTFGNSTLRVYEVNSTVPGWNNSWTGNVSWWWYFNVTFLNGSLQTNSTVLEATNSSITQLNLTLHYRYEGNTSNITDGIEIWISNTTNATYWDGHRGNFSTWNFSQIAHGNDIDLRLRWNGYERHYVINLTNASVNMTAYFSYPLSWFTFLTKTSTDQSLLSSSILTFQRQINATYTTVAQAITDAGGQAIVPLETDITYRISASHIGYTTVSSDTILVYIINPANTIYLTPTNVTIVGPYVNPWISNAMLSWNPWDYIIYYNTSANCTVNYTFIDTQSFTLEFTSNITYRGNHTGNVTNYNYYTVVSNSFTKNNLLTISPASYTFHICINRTTGNTSAWYCEDKLYICSRVSGIGSWNASASEAAGGLSVTTWKLLAFLALAIITGAAIKVSGMGAIIILAIGIAVCGWLGIFSLLETVLMVILCIAILRLVH